MKKHKKLLAIVLIGILFLPFKVYGAAETLGDLRSSYNALVKEQKDNANKTAATKAEIERKKKAIAQAQIDLQAAETEEKETEEKIQESNEHIEQLKWEAEKVLLYMQQLQGQNVYVEYVSGATSMTELITRVEAINQISDYITDTVDNLKEEIKNNEQLKIELQEKQKKLQAQIVSYEKIIEQNYNNLETYDKFADDIDTKVAAAKKQLDTYVDLCRSNLGKTDDNVKLDDCTKVPVNSGWMKPLKSGTITSLIGYRWGSYHNALDIGGNPEGTPVYAAAAGIVAGIQAKTSCGGNRVFINTNINGTKYTYFYYHLLSYNVKVGDVVDQNTVVGYVGGGRSTSYKYGGYDTCTTGAHLHFGIAYGWVSSHVGKGYVMEKLPGFGNYEGYKFTSRLDYYTG